MTLDEACRVLSVVPGAPEHVVRAAYLDQLPEKLDADLFQQKCDAVFQHVYDSYWDDGRSVCSNL